MNVRVPLSFYILAGHVPPTEEQTRSFMTREWYGGALDGRAAQMPNVVDWSRSEVNLSPLIPWLGNTDSTWARKLAKALPKRWPDLQGQLEVIELEVEIIGEGYA
ncbi:MAG: hypothetical protein FJ284_12280 [Planctomycetes bacterium]|nr:hypothetical protein [Planctomycetota bacterium]